MLSQPRALSIESLHEKYGERIHRYLERLVGTTDAEDLAQDVFEKAQRAVGTFRGDSRVLTWLYRIATNAAIDRLRTAGRHVDVCNGSPLSEDHSARHFTRPARRRPTQRESRP